MKRKTAVILSNKSGVLHSSLNFEFIQLSLDRLSMKFELVLHKYIQYGTLTDRNRRF